MGQYSIKELEKLSGIKAHTIRIWEKRYGLIAPQRTDTNIRYYSDTDLKKLINVSLLNGHGIKISAIARMDEDDLHDKVLQLSESINATEVHIDRLITGMLDLNEAGFDADLKILEDRFGFEYTVTEIVYPFLQKIGLLWQTGHITPAHEHFIANLIRQRLIVATAGLPIPSDSRPRAILYLPEHELHEIALLFYHYLARKHGLKTFYLGQSVPYEDLKVIYNTHRPHFLITTFTSSPSPQALNDYLHLLAQDFPSSRVLASGLLLRNTSFHYPPNLTVFQSAADLQNLLKDL